MTFVKIFVFRKKTWNGFLQGNAVRESLSNDMVWNAETQTKALNSIGIESSWEVDRQMLGRRIQLFSVEQKIKKQWYCLRTLSKGY